MYDYLIVGAGIYGSVCAFELNKAGKKVMVVDKRHHIGGNCFTEKIWGIDVHRYGPHIFHTNDQQIWDYVNKLTPFRSFKFSPVANYKGELYSMPFNMWTFYQIWGLSSPEEVAARLDIIKGKYKNPQNLEEKAISLVGNEIYEKLIKGYTQKQWMKEPRFLPASIISRLPVRVTYDDNYFNDMFQGIPENGYTEIFEKLLADVEIKLNCDFLSERSYFEGIGKRIIYTGPIDQFFNYKYGDLEYKSLKWEENYFEMDNYQGCAVMNYTDSETPFTRSIEHKHFNNQMQKGTFVSWEYPQKFQRGEEPFYPVNDEKNKKTYSLYQDETQLFPQYLFGGRLGSYKYYDMHQVFAAALKMVSKLIISD